VRTAARSILRVSLLLCAACGDDEPSREELAQACEDLADALVASAERCVIDPQGVRDHFLQSVANGDCDNIVELRDHDQFYDECIPFVQEIRCDRLLAGDYDSSCSQQLVSWDLPEPTP